MQRFLLLSLLFILLLASACTQEEDATTSVATEEVIFISGEKIRILGRVITNQPLSASDHGFQLAADENFSAPILISLGEKQGPGRFIGETSGLIINQNYFVRAFANVGGVDLFGETLEIKTLSPILESFNPTFSKPGQEMLILGSNFPEGTRVFFGTKEATILQNEFESRLRVRIPEASDEAIVKIRIQIQNETLEFSQPFEYQTGKYTLLGQFPQGQRIYDHVSFQNQNGLFFGLGTSWSMNYFEGFQRFDLQSETWKSVNFPGENRKGAFSTSNYLGGGAVEIYRDVYSFKRDLWKINGESFERLTDLPFDNYRSIALELNGQLIIAGGFGAESRKIRTFHPATNTWSTQSSAPIDIDFSLAWFTYNNKAYFISADANIWEYEPVSDSWQIFSNYPGSRGNGFGKAQVIGDKVYIGLYRQTEQLLELDLKTLIWKSKNTIPGLPQSITSGFIAFNSQIYILRCPENSVPGNIPMELYRFDPNGI